MPLRRSDELAGKLAVITGASRGIGAAIAEVLASKGATVALNYTSDGSKTRTHALAGKLQADYEVEAFGFQADLGTVEGPSRLIDGIRAHEWKTLPHFQIDIIINNAGVSVNRPIEETDAEDFDRQYHVNVRGPLFLMKAALPFLPSDRSGRIVNISSVSSSLGFQTQSVYGGTKAALEAMSRTWSRELAERCTVNVVNPGPVATEMWGNVTEEFAKNINPWLRNTPLAAIRKGIDSDELSKNAETLGGRPATELEVAKLVGLLCSPDAGFTTGSVLNANGGMKFVT